MRLVTSAGLLGGKKRSRGEERFVEMRTAYLNARELEFPRSKSYDDGTVEVGCSAV